MWALLWQCGCAPRASDPTKWDQDCLNACVPFPKAMTYPGAVPNWLCCHQFGLFESMFSTCGYFYVLVRALKIWISFSAAGKPNTIPATEMCLLLKASSQAARLALSKLALWRCQILPECTCQIPHWDSALHAQAYVCFYPDMDWLWPASGSIWLKMLLSSLALSPQAQWHSEVRIIGALTESYLLPDSVSDNLLVWTVSCSFLLFLILWIAFSRVVLKLIYIAVRLLSASFEGFHLPVWT